MVIGFDCTGFLRKGENTVTIYGAPLVLEKDVEYDPPINDETVIFTVEVRAAELGGAGETGEKGVLAEKSFTVKDVVNSGNSLRECVYTLTFENPSEIDNSAFFSQSVRCNDTPARFVEYYPQMREFAVEVHKNLAAGRIGKIIDAAEPLLKAFAQAQGVSLAKAEDGLEEALEDISDEGLAYELKTPDQFVFLPTCQGRLWRVGVMDSPEAARLIMEEVKDKPAALPAYDYELAAGKSSSGLSRILPLYIALIDGKWAIVR